MSHKPAAMVFAFAGSRMLVRSVAPAELPSLSDLEACEPFLAGPFNLGRVGDRDGVAVALAPETTCDGMEAKGLRDLFGVLPESLMALAFQEANAFQCGYCTPGFVLTARALLSEVSNPSDDEIRQALAGNLCRCGSYVKIVKAVRLAAAAINR